MKPGTVDRAKFQLLSHDLGLAFWETIGLLQSVWHITGRNAPRGDIGRYTNEEICVLIGWTRTPPAITIEHLIGRGWLDIHPDPAVRLYVHDWHEHAERWVKDAVRQPMYGSPEEITARNPDESGQVRETPDETRPVSDEPITNTDEVVTNPDGSVLLTLTSSNTITNTKTDTIVVESNARAPENDDRRRQVKDLLTKVGLTPVQIERTLELHPDDAEIAGVVKRAQEYAPDRPAAYAWTLLKQPPAKPRGGHSPPPAQERAAPESDIPLEGLRAVAGGTERLQAIARRDLDPESFGQFFEHLQVAGVSGSTVVVTHPSGRIVDWLQKQFDDYIVRKLGLPGVAACRVQRHRRQPPATQARASPAMH